MGLISLNNKKLKKLKELLELLEIFNITEEDLKKIHELCSETKQDKYGENIIKQNEEKAKNAVTPTEFLKQFDTTVEEFYPNGKHL